MTIKSVRRSIVFQPLAVVLVILLSPVLSWLDSDGPGAGLFKSSAQTISSCAADPSSNSIIRNYCVTLGGNTVAYGMDLVQLESDAVSAYLGLHGMTPADAPVVYSYGRSDLRSAVRAQMITILLGIISKDPSTRTAHETSLYDWLTSIERAQSV
jgi:hypothetical protein